MVYPFVRALAINQYEIHLENVIIFQSYETIIAVYDRVNNKYTLDFKHNYSKTTSKYRNIFMKKTSKEVNKLIKNNLIEIKELNK